MIDINVKVEGLDALAGAFARAPAITAVELAKAVEKSTLTVHAAALREAPVNKSFGGGNLRQKIKYFLTNPLRGVVESQAKYTGFVHEGTKPHIIVPVQKRALANTRTNQFFGKRVKHPGTRPNPFMTRAVTKSKQKINEFFKAAIVNILKTLPK